MERKFLISSECEQTLQRNLSRCSLKETNRSGGSNTFLEIKHKIAHLKIKRGHRLSSRTMQAQSKVI